MKTITPTWKQFILIVLLLSTATNFAQVPIASYNFNTGFQGWIDGGSDVAWLDSTNWDCTAVGSVYTKDDDITQNYLTSPSLNLAGGYNQIDFIFCLLSLNLESGEGFDLQYFDGTSWSTVRSYRFGTDWTTQGANVTHNFTFSMDGCSYTFPTNARFRMTGTGDNNNEYNIFDDILIQGWLGGGSPVEMEVTGLGNSIPDNDVTPSTTDDTDWGNVNVGSMVSHTFTISNQGTSANLLLTGAPMVMLSGSTDFTVTAQPGTNSIPVCGSTTFTIQYAPLTAGADVATVTILNNDINENPYDFVIQGNGLDLCGTPVSSYPYVESFESGLGLWTQDGGDNFDWSWTSNQTPSSGTGPGGAHDGTYYYFTEASGNYNNTANLISPCFDLSGTTNPRITLFYHMYGTDQGTLNVDISTDGGSTFPTSIISYSGEVQNATSSSWIPISYDLSAFIGQIISFRIQGITGSNFASDMAVDYVQVTDRPDPSTGPGGVTSDLAVWLKANDGHSYTDGQTVSLWQDQGLGGDAYTQAAGQQPTYHDNVNDNLNFNPVIEFDNSYATYTLDSDYSHDSGSGEFLTSDYGFHTQDMFIVLMPDDTPITNNFGFMDVFCSDAHIDTNATDATGIGFGYYTARVSGEIICYAHDSFNQSESGDGYAVAEIGTGSSYDNIMIINTRNNSADTQQELYLNSVDIETTQNDVAEYMNTNDARYWIGRSEGWESSLNARVVEVISYKNRKNDVDLTQERNRIMSYLAVKYGVTLGVNGTSQDYVDSRGDVIWDQSANAGFNYDIAGIGRDDNSNLNQKQSSSVNDAEDGIGPIEGLLTVGLTQIYDTNNLNIANNPDTFTDGAFLMWGNNGVDLNLPEAPVGVNMSAGIVPALSTNTSFTGMQRHWKFVETGGDVGPVTVRIAQDAIRNINPPGDYLMLISDTPVFDPTAAYEIMRPDGFGNLEASWDFDGTKYVTFGYAPQVIAERSILFDGIQDYVDMKDVLDLNQTEFTVSAWIKRDITSVNSSILSKRDFTYTQGYDFKINLLGQLEMSWTNGGLQTINSDVAIPAGRWHHVAAIYDGTTTRLYIDGVEAKAANMPAPPDTDEHFYIAAAGKNTQTQFFGGNIDEVRIWNVELSEDQLRYIMNQEIEDNASFVRGSVLPGTVTKDEVAAIPWSNLDAYYPMTIYTYTNINDMSGNNVKGALKNLDTVDRQTAPLPYESQGNGAWTTASVWLNNADQTLPNALSVVDGVTPIGWNIVRTNHDITIDTYTNLGYERSVLALMHESGEITILGDTASNTGNGLTVTHYLELDGDMDLEGESQLIQTLDSDLDVTSAGMLERDQQGTADVYTYNYWSSPVGVSNITSNNNAYRTQDVMFDGIQNINWITSGYDGTDTTPIGIADYWIWKFANQPDDDYSAWQHVRSTGTLLVGEGFTMKGPGSGAILDDQNYVYNGKPNNGAINLTLTAGNDYLVGNPYASAIDAHQFILDNGPTIAGAGATTGTLYFWEHWGGGSHNLAEYQGGYGTYNLSGGTPSASQGTNDPDVGTGGTPTKTPGRYIPVGQGFFVVAEASGTINFNNGQRIFQKEGASSIFMEAPGGGDMPIVGRAANSTENASADPRLKLRIGFNSVNTIRRQLLVTADPNATVDVDWGYDGKLFEDQIDDMYWMIQDEKHIIQGIDALAEDTVLPLGIHTNTEGTNSIVLDVIENDPGIEFDIYLHDKELDVYHDMRTGAYEFYKEAGEDLSRFEIVFKPSALSDDDPDLVEVDIHYSNDIESIVVENPTMKDIKSIQMYDVLGKPIYSENIDNNLSYAEYEVSNLSTGTYVIKINTLGGSFSKLVLVR